MSNITMEKEGLYREDLLELQRRAQDFAWPNLRGMCVSTQTQGEDSYRGLFRLELEAACDAEILEESLRTFQQIPEVSRILEPAWTQSFWDWLTKTKG